MLHLESSSSQLALGREATTIGGVHVTCLKPPLEALMLSSSNLCDGDENALRMRGTGDVHVPMASGRAARVQRDRKRRPYTHDMIHYK